jgi:hypothetical protein
MNITRGDHTMSHHHPDSAKLLAALASTALFAPFGVATAADSTTDFQQQVAALLSGTHATYAAPRLEVNGHAHQAPPIDAQESARRLLLGTTLAAQKQTQPHDSVRTHEALQARVQRLLLGEEAKL